MRTLIIAVALSAISATGFATERPLSLAQRVERQIDFALSQKLCYAPIVFEREKPSKKDLATIAKAAKKRGWSLSDGGGEYVVNVKNDTCTFL